MNNQLDMEMSTYRKREKKKEKTHQHKREEHITQERKRPSVERKENTKYRTKRKTHSDGERCYPPPDITLQ
jgi:hypothetical protein